MMKLNVFWPDSSRSLGYQNSSMTQAAFKKPLAAITLALLFSIGLTGCDSQSATFSVIEPEKQKVKVETAVAPSDAPQVVESFNGTAEAKPDMGGQSLLAAAKIDDADLDAPVQNDDNTLHATLIGDYEGVVPCSFCEGTTVTLNLFSDGSVIKTSVFEAPETPKAPESLSGVYRQDNDKITIVYEDKAIESFVIQDNHLLMLDKNKQPDADYMLSRK